MKDGKQMGPEPSSDRIVLDSREKLEADVDKFCLRLSDSGTVVGTEPLTRIRNAATRWLDRQAAITERECAECAINMGKYADSMCDPLKAENANLKAKVDELTDERDRLRGQLDEFDGGCYCGATVTEWYELAARLQDEVDELAEERDRLRNQVELKDDIIEGLRQSLDETIDERNGLAAQVEAKEQLERNSAYMRLPVDADGVPIRPGDRVDVINGTPCTFNVERMWLTRYGWAVHGRRPDEFRHVQPDTVESLLDEFMVALHELGEGADYGPTKERMAERIRRACNG